MPFLAQECASPPAFAVKALHFASMNAKPAALTARAAKRRGPPRRAFASFFQAEITPEKRKKEGTKCQRDNTPLGENYCGRRSKSPGECSKLTPPFTISRSGTLCLRWNSARGETCNPDHLTPTTDGSNGSGKYAKEKKESPFACPCRSRELPRPMLSERKQANHKHAAPSGFGRIGLCLRRPKGKTLPFRRFPVLTSTRRCAR